MMEIHNMMDFHHMVDIHHMMKFHHMMGFHHFVFSLWNQFQLWKNIMHWRSFSFRDELGEATVCGIHRLTDADDDQHGVDNQAASADGDPSVGWNMLQLLFKSESLYNYFRCCNCKRKQSLLHDTVLSNSNTTLRDFVLLMYQFCNSHRTYNTVAKETFLPQQLKKWKRTPIKLFDIIKVTNDFCKTQKSCWGCFLKSRLVSKKTLAKRIAF